MPVPNLKFPCRGLFLIMPKLLCGTPFGASPCEPSTSYLQQPWRCHHCRVKTYPSPSLRWNSMEAPFKQNSSLRTPSAVACYVGEWEVRTEYCMYDPRNTSDGAQKACGDRVQGFGLRIWDLAFRAWGIGCGGLRYEFKVLSLGLGLGVKVRGQRFGLPLCAETGPWAFGVSWQILGVPILGFPKTRRTALWSLYITD